MGVIANGLRSVLNTFINLLPEGANKASAQDTSNVAKSSPTLFDYDVFKINWTKISTLTEIDTMIKSDTRLKRANHVFASTAIRRGLTIKVTSEVNEALAAKGQEAIDEMLKSCQINSKLRPWTRSLIKDGELFLNCIVDTERKLIIDIKALPAMTMQRNENITGRFTDLADAFRQIDPVSREILGKFPLWAMNHIRFDHEPGQLYGNSQYLSCRAIWKKLTMTEEDLVVRRRTRAVPRRLHSVGSKEAPGDWTKVNEYKVQNNLNNPKMSAVTTDYFGNGLTDVKDLNADAQLDHIKDIEYLQELMMIGTAVPLHIMGFGANVNRDILEDQKKQFDEDCQEVRDLLEYGDEAPFSGLRAFCDLQLALRGIDSSLVEYNVMWAENDNDTVDQKVDRVVKLRTLADPLVSKEFALQYLGRDIGLENEAAVNDELAKQEEEKAVAQENAVKNAKDMAAVPPAPGKAFGDAKETNTNPLHSRKVVALEKRSPVMSGSSSG